MKKMAFILTAFLVSGLTVLAQTSPTTTSNQTNAPALLQREKFDPTRNAINDLQEAIVKAKTENKRIILDVGGEWCVWCRNMDFFFLRHNDLAKLRDENFVWLKINMSQENENKEFLAKYPAIKGYPHLFVLDKDGALLHSQDTSPLEQEKSYNLQRFTDFLKEWSPKKSAEK